MAITKYKLKNGQTRYRVSVYVDGIRIDQKGGFEKMKDARSYEAKVKARGKIERQWTYQEIEDLFLESYINSVKGSTFYSANRALQNHIPKEWRPRKIASIKPSELQALVNSLVENYAPATSTTYISIVSGVFRFAAKMKATDGNTFDSVIRPRSKKKPVEKWAVWTRKQISLFLQTCRDDYNPYTYAYFRMVLMTGMRIGESLAVRWKDFDYENLTLDIQQSIVGDAEGHQEIGTPKYDSVRKIAIDQETADAIQELRSFSSTERIFPVTPTTAHQWQYRLERTAGLPHTRMHNFRHEHATTLLKSGAYVKDVAERLGHKSVSTTLDIYADASHDKREVLRNLPDDFYDHLSSGHSPKA